MRTDQSYYIFNDALVGEITKRNQVLRKKDIEENILILSCLCHGS